MWIFTTRGFYSIVQNSQQSGNTLVRARLCGDLERLREICPEASEIVETPKRDYRFRVNVPDSVVPQLLARLAKEITYPNFKDAVKARQGPDRADLYGNVWETMYTAQDDQMVEERFGKVVEHG